MKEKVKKWITVYTVLAAIIFVSAVFDLLIGDYIVGLLSISIALFCISAEIKDQRIELLNELMELSNKKEAEAVKLAERRRKIILYKSSLLFLYSSKMYLAMATARFCKREIDTKTYLDSIKEWEDCIEDAREMVERRRKELEEEK